MIKKNAISWKQRIKELIVDYIFVLIYLCLLLVLGLGLYFVVFKGLPPFNEVQFQLFVTVTSVLPVVLLFSYLDYRKGSFGKQKAGLKLCYVNKNFTSSVVRNVVKFLPWQLGHIGTIRGFYTGFDGIATFFSMSGIALALCLLGMVFLRKDKRHLGDILARTQVQKV